MKSTTSVFLLVLLGFLTLNWRVYCFEPPVDLLKVSYDSYSRGKSPSLEEGRLVFSDQLQYYGTTIDYSVNFDKRDPSQVFVFFRKPIGRESTFIEYYKDTLSYYLSSAILALREIGYGLEMIEVDDNFLVPDGVLNVYSKMSASKGFYGFGVNRVSVAEERMEPSSVNWSDENWGFWEIVRGQIKFTSEYDPGKYEENTHYINASTVGESINEEFAFAPDAKTFEYKWIQKIEKYKDYACDIVVHNMDQIDYMLFEYENGLGTKTEPIRAGEYSCRISAFSEILRMRVSGVFKDNMRSGVTMRIRGAKIGD